MREIGSTVKFIFGMSGTIIGLNTIKHNEYALDHLGEVPAQLMSASISFYDSERYPYVVLREDGYKDVYGEESFE